MRFETTTLMPGGTLATLSVRPMGQHYRVGDDGGGRAALLALGIHQLTSGDTQRGNEIADKQGLIYDGEGFSLLDVSTDQIPAAIAYVADASRAWATGAIEARFKRLEEDLAEQTLGRLKAVLPGLEIVANRKLQGASSKQHRYDVVVTLPRHRFAVFETVVRRPSSIAAAHLKFFDLREAHDDWPREAVVDDYTAWPSDDLAVLQQVASHVRGFDRAWADLGLLTA